MSTPIKPPGGPSVGSAEPSSTEATSAPGAFEGAVAKEGVEAAEGAPGETRAAGADASSPVQALVEDVRAGRLDVDGAIDRLVERALSTSTGLPLEHRQALETQLRGALGEDPTLLALRKELERVSTG